MDMPQIGQPIDVEYIRIQDQVRIHTRTGNVHEVTISRISSKTLSWDDGDVLNTVITKTSIESVILLNRPMAKPNPGNDLMILVGDTPYVAVSASGRYLQVQGEHETPQYLNAEDIIQWEPAVILPKVVATQ